MAEGSITDSTETAAIDVRGLCACMECGMFKPYRLIREADRFFHKHRGHAGSWHLRDRRPGWRKTAGRTP